MKLEFARATHNIIDMEIINRLRDYSEVIVFGAGESGDWVTGVLRKHGIFPVCYCDNYKEKWGKMRNGLYIDSFEKVLLKWPNAAICIASMWSEDIFNQIAHYNKKCLCRTWDLLSSMAWETTNLQYISSEFDFINDNLVEFQCLYEGLKDDISKSTLLGLLNYRLTRDKSYLKEIKSDDDVYLDRSVISDEYYAKIINNIIIDGGAFDGDTVDMFIRFMEKNSAYKDMKSWEMRGGGAIHCYEINTENIKKIEDKIEAWAPYRIYTHNVALWNKSEEYVMFSGNGLSGKADSTDISKKNKVLTEAIDDYDYKEIGIIKLDIEGAEREALYGAELTIRKYRPILAICAYHLQDDLLVLFNFIMSLDCSYSIYLRHYMNSAGDTIMYAVPEKVLL